MLEYLQFEIGGYLNGFRKLEVYQKNGTVTIRHAAQFEDWKAYRFSGDADAWLSALEDVHINRWRSRYEYLAIMDGTQ